MKKPTPPKSWPEDYREWTGSIRELAAAAAEVLARLDPGVKPPNERLLRYYQQQGVLGRGRRVGNRAVFGFGDLERVIAAKGLVKQNWALSNAATLMASQEAKGAPVSGLLYSSPGTEPGPPTSSPPPESARDVVARLMARSTLRPAPAAGAGSLGVRGLVPQAQASWGTPVAPHGLGLGTPVAAAPQGSPSPCASSRPVQALQPAPWMSVYLDEVALRQATPAERQAALWALQAFVSSLS